MPMKKTAMEADAEGAPLPAGFHSDAGMSAGAVLELFAWGCV
jgi:hypothetical protein